MRRSNAPPARLPAAAVAAACLLATAPPAVTAQARAGVAVPGALPAWSPWAERLLLLGGLLSLDPGVRDGALDVRSSPGDDAAAFGRWYGDWHRSAPLVAAGALAAGLAGGSEGARRGAAVVLGALAGSMANETLNLAVGRARPADGNGPWRFAPFDGHASFPSGHTAYTFAIAGAIDEATDGPLPAALAYAAAGLTGVSRVYDDRHWLSDVAIGALVGAWTARRVTARALGLLGVDRGTRRGDGGTPPRGLGAWLASAEPVATGGFFGIRLVN